MNQEPVEYTLTKQSEERQNQSTLNKIKAHAYDVGAKVTLMGESHNGFALSEKTAEAAYGIGEKIVQHYRNRTQEPIRRNNPQKKDFKLT